MNYEGLDYDDAISKCIKNSFKDVRQISRETGLDIRIIKRRISQFRKDNIVYFCESQCIHSRQGPKPMKYKIKPNTDLL